MLTGIGDELWRVGRRPRLGPAEAGPYSEGVSAFGVMPSKSAASLINRCAVDIPLAFHFSSSYGEYRGCPKGNVKHRVGIFSTVAVIIGNSSSGVPYGVSWEECEALEGL